MKFFSRITWSATLLVLLNQQPVLSMGSKTPLEPQKTKTELVSELFETLHLDKLTIDDILKPIWEELQEVGFPSNPFAQTITAAKAALGDFFDPMLVLLKDVFTRAHEKEFSEAELKELIAIYKKPGNAKLYANLSNFIFAPFIKVLKDPKLFAEVSQSFLTAFVATIQNAPKDNLELSQVFIKEWEALNKDAFFLKPEFLENAKKQYPGLAPTLTKYFGDSITLEKIQNVANDILPSKTKMPDDALIPLPDVSQPILPEGASK